MLPPKLAELYGEMEKIRSETLSALSGLTDEEFSRKVGGEWSAAQILHHILMAETGMSKVIRKVIRTAAGSLPPYPADDAVLKVRELEKPLSAYQAPAAVRPEDPPGKADLLRLARETREQTAPSFATLTASSRTRSSVARTSETRSPCVVTTASWTRGSARRSARRSSPCPGPPPARASSPARPRVSRSRPRSP